MSNGVQWPQLMNWILQVGLVMTGLWYSLETMRMRRQSGEQIRLLRQQLALVGPRLRIAIVRDPNRAAHIAIDPTMRTEVKEGRVPFVIEIENDSGHTPQNIIAALFNPEKHHYLLPYWGLGNLPVGAPGSLFLRDGRRSLDEATELVGQYVGVAKRQLRRFLSSYRAPYWRLFVLYSDALGRTRAVIHDYDMRGADARLAETDEVMLRDVAG